MIYQEMSFRTKGMILGSKSQEVMILVLDHILVHKVSCLFRTRGMILGHRRCDLELEMSFRARGMILGHRRKM